MRCPACSADNDKSTRFCVMCGSMIQSFCPRCLTASEPGLSYCGECGAELSKADKMLSNEIGATKASVDSVEKWDKEFRSVGWGQENYERKIRRKLKEQIQLAEGEVVIFAASSGGWPVWVLSADHTEAALAHAIAGTNRRLIIWTSQAPDFGLSRFRELRYSDLKEVLELTELRIGKNTHQFDGLISIAFRQKNEVLSILVGRNATAPLLSFLKAACTAPIAVPVAHTSGRGSLANTHGERRDMAQKTLLQTLDDLASRLRSLEREKRETVARMQALERENRELVALVSQASAKVEEMLKEGATADVPQP